MKMEQRFIVQYCVLCGLTTTGTFNEMKGAYWHALFAQNSFLVASSILPAISRGFLNPFLVAPRSKVPNMVSSSTLVKSTES